MSELDSETQAWLYSLKLNKKLSTVADFQNGYNFGVIFDKLQLTRGKKFKNSSDLGCIFQNYKNVRDLLLENFNYDFPVNNIIYRTEDLLKVLKDEISKYVERKKIMTMKAATSTMSMPDKSLIQPQQQKQFRTRQQQINAGSLANFNQTAKLPRKIQDIERKLDKFRQQKTRHQLIALEERKQQIEQYRRVVMNNRDQQINKVKRLHEEGKQKQKKVYDVWYKNEQIKKQRIQTDKQFESFQNQKRNKLLQSLRKQQIDIINDGLQMFQLNCMRQGIELQKDPDKPMKPDGEFNKVVVMERIKDNISKSENDKKERIKRENQKRIDAEEAKIQSEALWTELNKVDDYSKKFQAHFKLCQSTYAVQKRMQAEKQARKQKYSKKQFIDLPAFEDQQTREQQFRQRKIEYLFNDAKWIEQRWKKQYSIAEQVVQALLQATIQGEQTYIKNQGFNYSEWKALQNKFLNYQDNRKKKNKDTKLYADYSTFNSKLNQYIFGQGSWKNFNNSKHLQKDSDNGQLTQCMALIISKAYPDKILPQINKIPLTMPLKVIFYGPRLTGKTTHSAKLAEKFGVIIINPKEILKQSIDLAKPPVQQDPKKAGKKDSKKVQELTPEKLALKQFGLKMLQKVTSVDQATISNLLQVIRFRVSQIFKQKSQKQVIQQYLSAKQKQRLRHQQALKDFEQAQKKPKKDSKKGAEPALQQPPRPNQCFYSGGFIIDDFPIDKESIRQLEKELNCFIAENERINQNGVDAKKYISLLLPIPEPPKDTRLKTGTFDLFFSLSAKEETLQKRKTGRKMDPQTKIIYHQTFNPIPDIKGFADKLIQLPAVDDEVIHKSCAKFQENIGQVSEFYSQFGIETCKISAFKQIRQDDDDTVQQTFQQIAKNIESILQAKYSQMQVKASHIGQKQNDDKKQKQQIDQKENEKNQQKVDQQNKDSQQKNSSQNKELNQLNINQIVDLKFSKQDCLQILQKYTIAVKKYEQGVKECLYNLDEERSKYIKQLIVVQKKFTSLINRPDDKAGKILNFQQNYNKLLSEQSNIVKDAEASKHLIQRLSQLYDSLWTAIGQKKNESVEQRTKFKESDWLNTQAQRVVQTSKMLLQVELNYLCETLFIILILSCKLQGKSFDYVTEYLSLGIAPNLEPIFTVEKDENDLITNKRLEYYINQTEKCIDLLPHWIQQKHKKMKIQRLPAVDNLIGGFVAATVARIRKSLHNIKNKVSERVLEERSYYQALLNKMDQWIIQGIKAENDFVYEIYKNMKKCIEQARKSSIKELHVKQITDVFYPIKELTLNPIPLRIQTYHRKIPIYSYMIFLEEVKTITNPEGKINFQIFKKYMDKRKKSQLLHPDILKIDYDTVQQYLVKDNYMYLKELAMAVVLWDVNVFDDDQLTVYKTKLLKKQLSKQEKQFKNKSLNGSKSSHSEQNLEAESEKNEGQRSEQVKQSSIKKRVSLISSFPVHKKLTLSELILMEGAFDAQEQYIIKHLIFQVFRDSGTEYVQAQNLLDTLSLFDQLQVLRYGDAVMMLNI